MKVAVLTSIYNDFDTLKPTLEQVGDVEVEWLFVTDSEAYAHGDADPLGWKVIYKPKLKVHPCRAAKRAKMLPSQYTNAPHSIWIDGSFRVLSPTMVIDMLAHARRYTSGFAQFKHPWRSCLYAEADASMELAKYGGEIQHIKPQVDSYRRFKFPVDWGLWATGVIARFDHERSYEWGRHWYNQVLAWSYQDQISQPFSLWTHAVQPVELPGSHMHNQWVRYEGSARHG